MITSAEDIGTGIQAMVETFQRLGLMWRLVKGTVFDSASNTPTLTLVTLDTDDNPSNCVSMIGTVAPDTRVYVLVVPPQGNYIVGFGSFGSVINEQGINNAGATDSSTSSSFANLAGTSSFDITKGSSGSRLKVAMQATAFLSAGSNTRLEWAALVDGVDNVVTNTFINPTLTHTLFAGAVYISGLAAGTYTIQGRWRRVSGAGTLARGSDDWLHMSAIELP